MKQMIAAGWIRRAKQDEQIPLNVEESKLKALAWALEVIQTKASVARTTEAPRHYRGKTRLDEYLN